MAGRGQSTPTLEVASSPLCGRQGAEYSDPGGGIVTVVWQAGGGVLPARRWNRHPCVAGREQSTPTQEVESSPLRGRQGVEYSYPGGGTVRLKTSKHSISS